MSDKREINPGDKFNHLTIIEEVQKNKHGQRQVLCFCDCGSAPKILPLHMITGGKTKSCGCLKLGEPISIGERFGKLTIIEQTDSNSRGESYFLCQCECGSPPKKIARKHLVNDTNPTRSCGCLQDGKPINIGDVFGALTIIDVAMPDKRNKRRFLCQCECGGTPTIVEGNSLLNGHSKSCGCLNKLNFEPGTQFGSLTVIEKTAPRRGRSQFICQCKCGKTIVVGGVPLKNGHTRSCGCLVMETISNTDPSEIWATEMKDYQRGCAINRGLSWELNMEEFIHLVQGDCHYCGDKPMTLTRTGMPKLVRNGIDREDNDVGYTIENSVSCCWPCNMLKRTLGKEKFLERIFKIADHQRSKIRVVAA